MTRANPYQARMFATAAHAAVSQTRKYTGEPYINHCRNVARMVVDRGGTPEMVCAAWLHDVLEDTGVTYTDVFEFFGYDVAKLVLELTDQCHDGNRAARKAAEAERLSKCSHEAQTIKCADLIDNTSSIVKHDLKFAKVYLAEKRALLMAMQKADPLMWNKAYVILTDAEFTLDTTPHNMP